MVNPAYGLMVMNNLFTGVVSGLTLLIGVNLARFIKGDYKKSWETVTAISFSFAIMFFLMVVILLLMD